MLTITITVTMVLLLSSVVLYSKSLATPTLMSAVPTILLWYSQGMQGSHKKGVILIQLGKS